MTSGGEKPSEIAVRQREWLEIRDYMRAHRATLSARAAEDYDCPRVNGTLLLTRDSWMPQQPLDLSAIELVWQTDDAQPSDMARDLPESSAVPPRVNGTRFSSYSHALGALAAPTVFENRTTYRLVDADFSSPPGRLVFADGHYFDGIDTGEAAAHEYAARELGYSFETPLRDSIGDPCDPSLRPMNLAITTLTVRQDRLSGEARFFLHWRDPAKVGHAGGMYQVIPVGVFQPSGEAEWNRGNDFSLWRAAMREFAEELAGRSEDWSSEKTPIDYESGPVTGELNRGLRQGRIQAWCLGLGVDPLTWAADLLTVVVMDSGVFDEIFGATLAASAANEEGQVLDALPADPDTLVRWARDERMQPAGAGTLLRAADSDLLRK